jgi:prepilin-type N-terminal cleavage/methylation domain-containing protein
MKKLEKAVAQVKDRLDLLAKINGKKDRKREKGFTLIELIAVVLILGILMVLVVPKILGSSDDADAKLIAKSVKDIRDATAMAKMKCLSTINNNGCNSAVGSFNPDTGTLLPALWDPQKDCQVMEQNAFTIDGNSAKIKDFGIQTDCQGGATSLVVAIDCAGNNNICTKVQEQLNKMYGNNTCPNAPSNGQLTCTLPL